jgi:hypothetical protein
MRDDDEPHDIEQQHDDLEQRLHPAVLSNSVRAKT